MSGSVGTPAPVKAGTAVSPSATPVAMPPISSIAPAHASGAATQSRLEASNLKKSYGARLVVKDVHLAVNAGEVVGLLGPNGAG